MSFELVRSTADRNYNRDQGHRAVAQWIRASASLARPADWNEGLHQRIATGEQIRPVALWRTSNATFDELFDVIARHPLDPATSGRLAAGDPPIMIPGIGIRLVQLSRPGSNHTRSFGVFVSPDHLVLFNPLQGILRFPRSTASTDVPAYLAHSFPGYVQGSAVVDIVLPEVDVHLQRPDPNAMPDAEMVRWAIGKLQTGHLILGERHASLPAKRLLLAILQDQIGAQTIKGIFLEGGTSRQTLRIANHSIREVMFGYWGVQEHGLRYDNPLGQLATQLQTQITHLGTPVWGIDPFEVHGSRNRGTPFVVDNIRLERYRGDKADPLKARATSEGVEVRNRNWARIFCRHAAPSGCVVICGASHIRPGSSAVVRSKHEYVQYLTGIQTVLSLVPQ